MKANLSGWTDSQKGKLQLQGGETFITHCYALWCLHCYSLHSIIFFFFRLFNTSQPFVSVKHDVHSHCCTNYIFQVRTLPALWLLEWRSTHSHYTQVGSSNRATFPVLKSHWKLLPKYRRAKNGSKNKASYKESSSLGFWDLKVLTQMQTHWQLSWVNAFIKLLILCLFVCRCKYVCMHYVLLYMFIYMYVNAFI